MMRQIMMTSAFVLAAAAFAMPAAAQTNTGSVKQEQAEMRKLQEVCAKNWPVVDKNDDTRISRQEAQEATKAEFKRIDADSNGTISAREWAACSAPELSADAIWTADPGLDDNEQFGALDLDSSGDVSALEAANLSKKEYSGGKGRVDETALSSGMTFAGLDADGDGMVSMTEWTNRKNASPDKTFSKVDKDQNKEVSEQEFTEHRNKRYGEAQKAQQQAQNESDEPGVWVYYYFLM
jgi:Ca2+-binding EF-hand superfamily protein